MIGFARFAAHLRQRFDDGAHLARTSPRVQVLLDAAAIGEQAHAIAAVQRHLRDGERGVHGVIKFREAQRAARLFHFRAQ